MLKFIVNFSQKNILSHSDLIELLIYNSIIQVKGERVIEKLSDQANLRKQIRLSRLEIDELLKALEQQLQISVKGEDREEITSVADLKSIIFLRLFESDTR